MLMYKICQYHSYVLSCCKAIQSFSRCFCLSLYKLIKYLTKGVIYSSFNECVYIFIFFFYSLDKLTGITNENLFVNFLKYLKRHVHRHVNFNALILKYNNGKLSFFELPKNVANVIHFYIKKKIKPFW